MVNFFICWCEFVFVVFMLDFFFKNREDDLLWNYEWSEVLCFFFKLEMYYDLMIKILLFKRVEEEIEFLGRKRNGYCCVVLR